MMSAANQPLRACRGTKAVLGLVALVAALSLPACATRPPDRPPSCQLPQLVAVQLPDRVRDASLQRVMNAKKKTDAAELARDREQLAQQVRSMMSASLEARSFRPVAGPGAQDGLDRIGRDIDPAALAALQTDRPADIYLRWRVTDYGETPVRWRASYVTFEVVSTLAITGALYLNKVTRPVAGIYLLQEGIEELSEGYAGFWMLNRLSRPVRIEADLVDGQGGRVLWTGSRTGLARWRWHNLWHKGAGIRNDLLAISARKAVDGIADDALRQACRSVRQASGPGADWSRRSP